MKGGEAVFAWELGGSLSIVRKKKTSGAKSESKKGRRRKRCD